MKILVQLSRFLTGGLFIFSGLIKANDPVGFAVKLEDYFLVFAETIPFFSSDFMLGLTLSMAWFICVFEVILGVALLLGMKRKTVAISLLGLIIFFTWLTGYSAVTGKVTDCGCFGDAIPLTPWESFYKDIILFVLIAIISIDVFIWPKVIKPIFPSFIRTGLFIGATVFTAWVGTTAINHLPFKDFRAYKIGVDIKEGMELPPGAKEEIREITWTYKNKATGEIKEFAGDPPKDYQNWDYVDRIDKVVQEADLPPIHDFILYDKYGDQVTDRVLSNEDVYLLAISPDLEKTAEKGWSRFIELQLAAEAEGISAFGLVAAGPEAIEEFRHQSQAAFPFFSADHKTLKTIIRTDPGIMLMRGSVILDKWSWRDLPDFSSMKQDHFKDRVARQPARGTNAIFNPGDYIPGLITSGREHVEEFFAVDADGSDVSDQLLSDTAYWVLVRQVSDITESSWATLLPFLQKMQDEEIVYHVLTGSGEDELLPMREASGLEFDYYFSDADLIEKIAPANVIILRMSGGQVLEKWGEGEFPAEL